VIERLHKKNVIDVIEFLQRVPDKYEDLYITVDKKRIFLKNNFRLVRKLLKQQEMYGLFVKDMEAIMIIYREKGFRPYLKILSANNKYAIDCIKFIGWNFYEKEFYAKLKIENPLVAVFLKKIFMKIGNRGQEVLLVKKAIKDYHKIVPKND